MQKRVRAKKRENSIHLDRETNRMTWMIHRLKYQQTVRLQKSEAGNKREIQKMTFLKKQLRSERGQG